MNIYARTVVALAFLILSSAAGAAEVGPRGIEDGSLAVSRATGVRATHALIERLLPAQASLFVCEVIAPADGKDVFEIESRDGKIVLRGNSPLSQAVALNWYLKYYCHCHVSLNGRQLYLPAELPTVKEKVRIVGWAQSRYFLNYVTYGYQMPWWDWKQWERFIDWMALSGINQPLAITGQEAVWEAVGKRFGMTDAELETFLPGTPYLPFCWMGCLDSYGGPLPKNWIPRHVELGKKILARERELGMTPVLQGFTGHVPEAIVEKFPGTKAQRFLWNGFNNAWILDPADPLFQKLGDAWIEEQTKLFGTDHLYDADPFIEMAPPNGDLTYLANAGRAIYDGMAKSDPKAVWLLQSWPFMFKASFWSQERTKAFLDAVPGDRMLVLDLFCDRSPVWNKTQGFYGKPWVWNFVYNFGNNTMIGGSGPIERFNDLATARKNPLGKNLRGVGMMMEGFDHNPLIFDIMFELPWREGVDLKPWVKEFSRFRYGKENVHAQAAWETLRTSIYSRDRAAVRTVVTAFPSTGNQNVNQFGRDLTKALRQLLAAEPELGQTETYRHDLVNLTREFVSNHANTLYGEVMAAVQAKDSAAFRQKSAEFLKLLGEEDELLATNEEFLLGKWLEDAKRWGETDAERAKLEWNARRILTLWGNGTCLRDYAMKEWSGMMTGFYAKRWEIFFKRQQEALDSGKPFNQAECGAEIYKFENDWSDARETYPAKAVGDSISVARRLYEKYAPKPIANRALDRPVACSMALPWMEAGLANDGIVDAGS